MEFGLEPVKRDKVQTLGQGGTFPSVSLDLTDESFGLQLCDLVPPRELRLRWTHSIVRLGHGSTPSRSEEHTSELQSLMRLQSAVLCLTTHKILIHNKQLL